MLEKLQIYIEDPNEPYDPFIRVDAVDLSGDDALLSISVRDHHGTLEWSRWEVKVPGLRDYRILEAYGDLQVFAGDHVLALQHTDAQTDLFFRGKPSSPDEVVGQLLIAHREVTGGWFAFDRFLNETCNPEELFELGYGVLAKGPVFLLEAYEKVLSGASLKANLVNPRPAGSWNGEKWVEDKTPLHVLVLGESYFVAEGFEERKVSDKAEGQ